MKKLLLRINLIFFLFVIFSCQHNAKPEQVMASTSKVDIKDSIPVSDTTKINNKTSTTGVAGNGSGVSKENKTNVQKDKAIIHHAPHESKIDSIKNAKLKGKK